MNFIHVGFGLGLWTLGTVYTPPQQYFDFQVDFSVLNGRASIGNEAVQGGTVAVVDDAQDTTYASSASLKFSAVCKAVGPLKYGECFVHDPWICLGNEEKIQNYDKKNFEIYVDLLGQTLEQK